MDAREKICVALPHGCRAQLKMIALMRGQTLQQLVSAVLVDLARSHIGEIQPVRAGSHADRKADIREKDHDR